MTKDTKDSKGEDGPDPILLSLFANRFMSVAESMGKSLQQTSISTNIKERLDFSCALFSPDGSLVANAPHLPVHLGKHVFRRQVPNRTSQIDSQTMKRGDVLMANMPVAGGSHLPDITCITPCHAEDSDEIIFFCASRGHHADIGGITADRCLLRQRHCSRKVPAFCRSRSLAKVNSIVKDLKSILSRNPHSILVVRVLDASEMSNRIFKHRLRRIRRVSTLSTHLWPNGDWRRFNSTWSTFERMQSRPFAPCCVTLRSVEEQTSCMQSTT